ncbi:hypothetical protein NZNM25_14610 [Nitrosopumilus zosterae]|uniref:HPt domain-containing protein n=1 Tax=Nitrosopumilus zosterae TaxID=718286 RepID=A0A2S2KSL3_9ARCH|nr:Hpt domain-containing protein [Nitrosopumilus zosterae]BDQ30716.1 Hpt domain-containing protein [Nitrosopumilus zosterae]GBH34670.1 hypothetical protein NZNM25_14610 [Nitrosopumilus zosterae]
MSDEFIKIATAEINEEISAISSILNSCTANEDVFQNSKELQSHTHKIKGLAPMMGQEELGSICSMLDAVLKQINDGKKIEGIYDIFTESLPFMKNSMSEPGYDMTSIIDKVTNFSSNVK